MNDGTRMAAAATVTTMASFVGARPQDYSPLLLTRGMFSWVSVLYYESSAVPAVPWQVCGLLHSGEV